MTISRTIRFRKGAIVKVVLAIPFLWFTVVGFMVVMTGNDYHGGDRLDSSNQDAVQIDRMQRDINHNANADIRTTKLYKPTNPAQNIIEPPVIEAPQAKDRGRLIQKMAEDAERRLREQEKLRHDQLGEETLKRANEPVQPMNPFHSHVIKDKIQRGEPAPMIHNDPNAPGEQGRPVSIDKNKLSPEERQVYEKGWQRNAFNQYASDMISIHRSLPDVRDKECRSAQYQSQLPDTSVIVIFHNEAWSVLLRTVHSVLDRSPPELLREVILVDDKSDFEHLQDQLQDYVNRQDKVKLVRAKKREGLIRARLLGASVAVGDSLTFLDSHCEATEGWLEPLLSRIGMNESNVVCPVIDVIEDETLKYVHHQGAGSVQIGGFDWNLQYNWHPVPDREKKRRQSFIDPIHSPTMAGGLFSISKAYFEKLGTYDPGMDIWGGENLELSFRVWMCGGTLEVVPCSHVGHIFRKRSPYSWKTGVNVVKKNCVRLAEVWMDEYKTYYYERFNFDLGDYGDVSGRKQLRQDLHCKSFDWYVRNIFPELFIPGDSIASGEIRNKAKAMCVDSPVDHHSYNKAIKMWPCHNQGGNQYWMLGKTGEIRRDEGCLDYAGQFVMIYPCHGMKGNQEWVYGTDNTLRHKNTNLCLTLSDEDKKVEMKPCTGIDRQIWTWKRKEPDPHPAKNS